MYPRKHPKLNNLILIFNLKIITKEKITINRKFDKIEAMKEFDRKTMYIMVASFNPHVDFLKVTKFHTIRSLTPMISSKLYFPNLQSLSYSFDITCHLSRVRERLMCGLVPLGVLFSMKSGVGVLFFMTSWFPLLYKRT